MYQITLERLERQIVKLRDLLDIQGVNYGSESVSKSSGEGYIPNNVLELIECLEELTAMQSTYLDLQRESEWVIRQVSNPWGRRALGLRYLDSMSYSEIGKTMGYSTEGARKLCNKAVASLDPVLHELIRKYRKELQ